MSDEPQVPTDRTSLHELLKLHDEEFVRSAYRNVLGREPDPTGLAGYLKQVRRGADKGRILADMATSEEALKKDPLRLPGLKEVIDASKSSSNRTSLLVRTLSRLTGGRLRPLHDRVQVSEYHLAELAETIALRLRYVEERTESTALRLQHMEVQAGPAGSCATDAEARGVLDRAEAVTARAATNIDLLSASGGSLEMYARRSHADRRRKRLERAFGGAIITDRFFAEVLTISLQVKEISSGIDDLLDDVVIARWKLSGETNKGSFDQFSTQLDILHHSVFKSSDGSRSAAEIEVCNEVAARAISDPHKPTSFPGIPITAFMLAAINSHSSKRLNLESAETRDSLCSYFFLSVVPACGLEHWVTPSQRESLRRPATDGRWKRQLTVLQSWLLESDPQLLERFPAARKSALEAFQAWYFDEGVWDKKLDYSLSDEQLAAAQLSICRKNDTELVVPKYFRLKGLIPDDIDSGNAQDWLRECILHERPKQDIPRRLFDPIVFDHLWGSRGTLKQFSTKHAALSTERKHGLRTVRPGQFLCFGESGNGQQHLIGKSWSYPEKGHVWSAEHSALLAMNINPEDDGWLDLFLELLVGSQVQASVSILWNGRMVERVRATPHSTMRVTCDLGKEHRLGAASNILCVFVDHLWRPSNDGALDGRTLGVGLSKLKFAKR